MSYSVSGFLHGATEAVKLRNKIVIKDKVPSFLLHFFCTSQQQENIFEVITRLFYCYALNVIFSTALQLP